MSERREPFVAHLIATSIDGPQGNEPYGTCMYGSAGPGDLTVPVVVTPLEPDDPRPGDVWYWETDDKLVQVATAPFENFGGRSVGVRYPGHASVFYALLSDLSRPPALKTFRAKGGAYVDDGDFIVRAASREDALAQISEALEEVEDDG